jgi:predicted permease
MSIRAWWNRLRGTLGRPDTLTREMEREMAFHVEMSAKRNRERGMTPEVAEREARLAFGSAAAVSEEAREAHRSMLLENLFADVRFAIRGLRRSPSFATATMLTMALGIAASTAIFSVVDAVLLRPLPIPQPDDFVYVGWVWEKGGDTPSLTAFQYDFVRTYSRTLASVASYSANEGRLGFTADGPVTRGLRVSGDFFGTIGFSPWMGRQFDANEIATDAPAVILGHSVWRTQFGSDPAIVGKKVLLEDQPLTVVGVMPPEFRFPPATANEGYLLPHTIRANRADEGHNTEVIARMRHGTSTAEREADVHALSQRFATAFPGLASPHEAFKVYSHRDVYAGSLRRVLWVLLGASSLLLLIACANTATLLLVRSSSRQREIAVRASIGAGPLRIMQQLLTEGLVLALLSTVVGVVLGVVALRSFLAVAPAVLPEGMTPALDARAVVFALVMSGFTGVVFGLAAAVPAFRVRLQSTMLSGIRAAGGGGSRTREILIFLESTAAVVLLAGASVVTVSFARLMRVNPGFDSHQVVAVRLGKLPASYDANRRIATIDRLLDRVRHIPGVEHAAAAPNLPLERGMNFVVDTRDHPERAVGGVEIRFVSPDYFATLGVPLTGRDFTSDDAATSMPVAIVNETLAKRLWDGEPAMGQSMQIGHFKDRWMNDKLAHQTVVVGVAQDMHEVGLDRAPRPTLLIPRLQAFDDRVPVILVRGEPGQITTALLREIKEEEPQLKPSVERLDAVVSHSVAGPRFRSMLIGSFAGAALLLAAIGIYGVIAAVVDQRRREIGIRLTLGATQASVTVGVVRRCMVFVCGGAGVGLAIFWAIRQSLSSMVFNTSVSDPRMVAMAIVALAIVAAVAAWIPARRASHVDPAMTLRLD